MENIESKIPDITKLATNTNLNDKINKWEIPNITNSPTATALTALENKILNVSNLIKKTYYNTKISEIQEKITDHDHDRYITTLECNKLTAENFASRLAQANLATKNDIAALTKDTDFDNKLKKSNKNVTSSKFNELNELQEFNELSEKVKAISAKGLTKDLINKFSILNGARVFQNYLVVILPKNTHNIIHGNLMEFQENIENITKSGSNFAPTFVDHHLLPDIHFDGHCLTKK